MKIVGCDLHARQQSLAMLDTESGEFSEKTLVHEGNGVREFYSALEGPVVVGIEATGAMQWFLELLEELGIEYRVGHPAKIRAQETRFAPATAVCPFECGNGIVELFKSGREAIAFLLQLLKC